MWECFQVSSIPVPFHFSRFLQLPPLSDAKNSQQHLLKTVAKFNKHVLEPVKSGVYSTVQVIYTEDTEVYR